MVKGSSVWKCECGNVGYGSYPPEECSKCWKTNNFIEVSEDMAEEMKDKVIDEIRVDDLEEEVYDEE